MKTSKLSILILIAIPTLAFVQRSGPSPLPVGGIICKDECPNWTHCSIYGTEFQYMGICRAVDQIPIPEKCQNTKWSKYNCTAGSATIGAKFEDYSVFGDCGAFEECYGS